MTEPNLQELMDKVFKNIKQEQSDAKALFEATFDPTKFNLFKDYFYNLGGVSLASLCTTEMRDFLFANTLDPVIRRDEPSMVRKQMYNDKILFCSYYFADPLDGYTFMPEISVDMTASKKPISDQLKSTLEDLDFFADSIIDFEAFEFPHYSNDTYYGQIHADEIKKMHQNLSVNNKEISKVFKKGNTPLYRDTEKIHLQFAAGKGKDGQLKFVPVYVGIGTNEPSNLTFNGKLGKSRFIKYKFDEQNSGIELGRLIERPISLDEFNIKFNGMNTYDICYGKDWIIYDIVDQKPNPTYEAFNTVCYDQDRFKGFFKVYYNKSKSQERAVMITPEFTYTSVEQKKYLEEILRKGSNNSNNTNRALLRNPKDILNLLDSAIVEYDAFSSVQYHPQHIVKIFGMDEVFKKVCTKLDKGDFCYADALNIASDVHTLGTESFERLKISSLILGNYITSGKFDELLTNTYNDEKTTPL